MVAPEMASTGLVFNAEPIYSALIRRIFNERHIVPRVKASANEDAVLLNMVSQDVGLLIGSDHRQMHTADTLLKPLKQDAVHRYIYMAYLKNGAYTSAVEQIIAFAEAHALQEEGTQLRSGFAPANRQKNRIPPEPRHEAECAGGLCMTGQSVEFAVQCFCRRTVIN